MSVVINTNYAATMAANNLANSNAMLQKSLNRLSSGSRIVSPSDDAGGLAVAMKLSAEAKQLGARSTNLSNEVSYYQTQDGALKVVAKILDRMSELSTLNGDATKSAADKSNYNVEFTALAGQLSTAGTGIKDLTFNGVSLFGATAIGGGKDATAFTNVLATDIGDLAKINTAIINTATQRAINGSAQSVRGFEAEMLVVTKANLEAATSRIMDVDVAEESTQLARWNILVQSGTAMLAQANQAANAVLKLLQ